VSLPRFDYLIRRLAERRTIVVEHDAVLVVDDLRL
jgi:hypothetical protein